MHSSAQIFVQNAKWLQYQKIFKKTGHVMREGSQPPSCSQLL
jgi:hypothetical protein